MEEKTKRVLRAASALSKSEREALAAAITNYERVALSESRTFSEVLNRNLGPLMTSGCPVCGK